MMTFRGLVKRDNGNSPDGGFIITAMTSDGYDTKVNIAAGALTSPPPKGASVKIIGAHVKGGEAWEITATKVTVVLPEGNEIIDLLAHHPMFRDIEWRSVKMLWRKLNRKVYDALNSWDAEGLISTLLPTAAVIRLLRTWHEYVAYVEFREYMQEYALPAQVEDAVWCMYGSDSTSRLRANPYRVAQFLPWHQADEICASLASEPSKAQVRNIAAVHWVVETEISQGRYWLPVGKVAAEVTALLGHEVNAKQALQDAIDSGICAKTNMGGSDVVWGATAAGMFGRIMTEFDAATPLETSTGNAHGKAEALVRTFPQLIESVRARRRCVIHVPHLAMTALSNVQIRNVVHVTLLNPASSEGSSRLCNSLSFSDLIHGVPRVLARESNTVALIHWTHMLDLVCINKLISILPKTWSWCLAGDVDAANRVNQGGLFDTLYQRQGMRITLAPAFAGISQIVANSKGNNRTDNDGCPEPQPLIGDAIEATSGDVLKVARKAYLRAATSGSVIAVADTVAFSNLLNGVLHAEAQERREFLKEDVTTLDLPNGQRVAVGDPLIYGGQDISRTLLRGATGSLIRIFERPMFVMQPNGTVHAFVAEARFDTAGLITLTQSDLHHLSLAYAIPCSTRLFGQFTKCICILEEGSDRMADVLLSASIIATNRLIISSAPAVSQQPQPKVKEIS